METIVERPAALDVHMGETYRDLGGDFFTYRDPERQTRRLVAQLGRLGHRVTLTEGAAAA